VPEVSGSLSAMQGHVPVPPQPPLGLGPVIGYIATREPQPLEDRVPVAPEWWEDEVEEWGPRHPPLVRVTAAVVAICLVVGGFSTVLEMILTSR
jgi:hypothetical protein